MYCRYAKDKIALAPNNPSAWNFLRGVLEQSHTPFSTLTPFTEPYTLSSLPSEADEVVDLDNPKPGPEAQLPCVPALDFLAEAKVREGTEEGTKRAVEIWKEMGTVHDTMRKKCVIFVLSGMSQS